jgi:hypothetical protein
VLREPRRLPAVLSIEEVTLLFELNLYAALLARDANPRIRIVLRQFNRTLGHKIEQNLPNCSVLSLAWHSAATYAAAALDPACFRGLQFPEPDGPLTGFATRIARNCGAAGATIAQAERLLSARILSVDGKTDFDRDVVLASRAVLVVYGAIARPDSSAARPRVVRTRPALGHRLRSHWHPSRRQPPRLNPILARLAAVALVIFFWALGIFTVPSDGSAPSILWSQR